MSDPREQLRTLIERAKAIVHAHYAKSISEITRQYQDALENLIVDATNGSIKTAAFRTRHNTLIDELAKEVYIEGMREGGLSEDELDDEDEAAIEAWRLEQFGYVLDFAKAAVDVSKLEGDERTAARDAMMGRVEMWVQKLADLGARGYARAKEGEKAYWELGETETHCTDCLANSKRAPRRLKVWLENDWLPRSSWLECTGLHCDCTLKSVKTNKVLYPR